MRYAHALLSQGYVFVLRKVWEAGSGRAEWKLLGAPSKGHRLSADDY